MNNTQDAIPPFGAATGSGTAAPSPMSSKGHLFNDKLTDGGRKTHE